MHGELGRRVAGARLRPSNFPPRLQLPELQGHVPAAAQHGLSTHLRHRQSFDRFAVGTLDVVDRLAAVNTPDTESAVPVGSCKVVE